MQYNFIYIKLIYIYLYVHIYKQILYTKNIHNIYLLVVPV